MSEFRLGKTGKENIGAAHATRHPRRVARDAGGRVAAPRDVTARASAAAPSIPTKHVADKLDTIKALFGDVTHFCKKRLRQWRRKIEEFQFFEIKKILIVFSGS